jgi:hypothetical protein
VDEVCQQAYLCPREASIGITILEVNLLRGFGGIPELRVFHFIHHMRHLFVQLCKYVKCDRDNSSLFGPRFIKCFTERRWAILDFYRSKKDLFDLGYLKNCVTSSAYTLLILHLRLWSLRCAIGSFKFPTSIVQPVAELLYRLHYCGSNRFLLLDFFMF